MTYDDEGFAYFVFDEETQRWVDPNEGKETAYTYNMYESDFSRSGSTMQERSGISDVMNPLVRDYQLRQDHAVDAVRVNTTPRLMKWGRWSANIASVFLSKWLVWFFVCRWIGFFFLKRAFFFSGGKVPVILEKKSPSFRRGEDRSGL